MHESTIATTDAVCSGNCNVAMDVRAVTTLVCLVASGVSTNACTNSGLSKDKEPAVKS